MTSNTASFFSQSFIWLLPRTDKRLRFRLVLSLFWIRLDGYCGGLYPYSCGELGCASDCGLTDFGCRFRGDSLCLCFPGECCGRRCTLWSKDGRGSTVPAEVNSLFMISACAASVVSICIKICRNFFQLSFVFS